MPSLLTSTPGNHERLFINSTLARLCSTPRPYESPDPVNLMQARLAQGLQRVRDSALHKDRSIFQLPAMQYPS